MSRDLEGIKSKVMAEISSGRVRMKPRAYFVLGSILTTVGLALSAVASVFLFGLIKFSLRMQSGMGGRGRWLAMIDAFSWWVPVMGVVGLVAGVLLLRQYDVSYKQKFWVVATFFVLSMIVAGLIVDFAGLNEIIFMHGPMRGQFRNFQQ